MLAKKLPVKKVARKVTSKTATKSINLKEDAGTPLSVVIRRRIEAQKARFHANDNIAAFIEPGELDGLVDEVAQKMQGVLESLVIDTKSDHNTKNTSQRVAKMFVKEVFNGRYVEQPTLTKFPNVSRLNELMIVGPLPSGVLVHITCVPSWDVYGLVCCLVRSPHLLGFRSTLD